MIDDMMMGYVGEGRGREIEDSIIMLINDQLISIQLLRFCTHVTLLVGSQRPRSHRGACIESPRAARMHAMKGNRQRDPLSIIGSLLALHRCSRN